MIGALRRAYANFRGFDIDGSTVPPMDGPLRPNAALDAAPVAIVLPEIDNLTVSGGALNCSVGNELLTLRIAGSDRDPKLVVADREAFDHPISSLASEHSAGLAIGLDGRGILLKGGRYDGARIEGLASDRLHSVTAMAFAGPDLLLVCNGSRQHRAAEWKRDLMSRSASGSLWKVELSKAGMPVTQIAGGLAFPTGVAAAGNRIVFSEAWRHRILSVDLEGGMPDPVQTGLPAYPGRIVRAHDGGFWLALFAPRNPLVEFVLKENAYRHRMIETIDPAYWIAPSLVTGRSFLEPIQGGARKKLNILKPWAPTWSGGLVAHCDSAMRPTASYHSRADGNVHGVTSICETNNTLLVAAKGSGVIVAIDLAVELQSA
jgi:hypothetical protein